ncbi:MAG: 4-hydroxy-tetrahydrodipicolinate synthase [Clostridia bacterium]|nr:4-hydroxy-tetrahydrodipicolinate synthase [Clostridia bacterium]
MGKKQQVFFGSGCALVTPFRNGEIDYEVLEELIDFQIRNGTDAIILLGTTGEASTINESEREKIIPFAKEKIKGRVPLVVGTGTNSTEVSVRYTKMAQDLGANACLAVTPYYNKATEGGLIEHYKKVAGSVDIPIILYNVPSRTGVSLSSRVYKELAPIENIVAVKEASGSVAYMQRLICDFGADFDVYSGNDELTLTNLALGGKGVISVCANLTPSLMHQLCYEFANDNPNKARELEYKLLPLIDELFKEVNPIPVKTALYLMGMVKNEFRLPLCKSTRLNELENVLSQLNLV